jgi:hypothetical protein
MMGLAELLIILSILGVILCPMVILVVVVVVVVMKRRDGEG